VTRVREREEEVSSTLFRSGEYNSNVQLQYIELKRWTPPHGKLEQRRAHAALRAGVRNRLSGAVMRGVG
jgi:hypothetical protein